MGKDKPGFLTPKAIANRIKAKGLQKLRWYCQMCQKQCRDEAKCVVDYTEKGWFVQYIDRDPETIRKQEASRAKEKMDMDDEERTAQFIQKQIERAAETGKQHAEVEYTELKRDDEGEKEGKKSEKSGDKRKAKSALDEIMEVEEKKKEKQNRKDYWLTKGIVVKVMLKRLGEKYYKKKAYVKEVQDLYTGVIKMLDSGDVLKIDQTHVETVIPALGKAVMVVNGAYRGEEAILESIDEKKFCCSIRISQGLLKGRVVHGVQYEDISKLHV
nr:hypothetical protein BaRGS_029360 [Batillaria attramentaria]